MKNYWKLFRVEYRASERWAFILGFIGILGDWIVNSDELLGHPFHVLIVATLIYFAVIKIVTNVILALVGVYLYKRSGFQ